MQGHMIRSLLAVVVGWFVAIGPAARGADPADWPTYNHDPAGWRFNPAEKTLGPANVGGARREVAVPRGGLQGDDRRRPRDTDGRRRGGLLRHRHLPRLLQARARTASNSGSIATRSGRPSCRRPTGRPSRTSSATRRRTRASSPRHWSRTGPSTSRTRAAGCTASTPRPARNAGRSTPAPRSSPAPTGTTS